MRPSTPPTAPGSLGDAPRVVGRYRLLSLLARGGMSTVYLATAVGPAGFRKVLVLKLLRSDLAEVPSYAAMFLDEARLSALLDHPNIVQTFEVGRDAGFSYLAMEYLEGQPLSRVIRRARGEGMPIPTPIALHVVARVLDALAHAHRATDLEGRPMGIVHRDVSPENIFLTYDGRVKLVDFGVAKASIAREETRVGTFQGKIAYMPPEQARGESVDHRADLFAAGAVLWEMLSGRRLWNGRTDPMIAAELLEGRIPHPLAECPELAFDEAHVLQRALAASPEERHPSADALRSDLESLQSYSSAITSTHVAAFLGALFAEEHGHATQLVQQRLRALDAGEEIPSAALSGKIFGTPTDETDLAHTAVSRPQASGGVGDARKRAVRRSALGLASTSALLLVGLLASRAIGLSTGMPPSADGAPAVPAMDARPGAPPPVAAPPPRCGAGPVVELTGDVEEDFTLHCETRYLLRNVTTVLPGATLTIEPGTVILGDPDTRGALVVEPRGRLIAVGSPEEPIVFTSARPEGERRAGDWGGVILLGNAPINARDANGAHAKGTVEGLVRGGRYGGSNPDDDSGRLRFVRIEYGGTAIAPNNEINGLTLAGVGRGTVVDHVQVRETLDDCFEFFGGSVDAHHLICDAPGDDAFDWDLGYTGRLQFLLMRDDPAVSDASNGFEGDSAPDGAVGLPRSAPTIYNATLCGNGGDGPRPSYGVVLRHGSAGSIHDAIVSSFHVGYDRRGHTTGGEVRSTAFVAHSRYDLGTAERDVGDDANDDEGFDETRWLAASHRANTTDVPVGFDCRAMNGDGYKPTEAVTEGASTPPDDGFFDPRAAFLGAFQDRDDAWDEGAWVVPPD